MLSTVVAAFGANVVGADEFTAVGAGNKAIDLKFEVGAAQSLAGFADSSLWDRHGSFLLFETREL